MSRAKPPRKKQFNPVKSLHSQITEKSLRAYYGVIRSNLWLCDSTIQEKIIIHNVDKLKIVQNKKLSEYIRQKFLIEELETPQLWRMWLSFFCLDGDEPFTHEFILNEGGGVVRPGDFTAHINEKTAEVEALVGDAYVGHAWIMVCDPTIDLDPLADGFKETLMQNGICSREINESMGLIRKLAQINIDDKYNHDLNDVVTNIEAYEKVRGITLTGERNETC